MHTQIEQMVTDFERGRLSRRQLIAHLSAAAAALAGAAGLAAAQSEAATFRSTSVDHIALRVTDVERSRDFYRRHLGLEPTSNCSSDQCFLSCGNDFLALFRAATPGLDHYAFAVEGYRPADAVARLEAAGLEPRRHSNRVYFDDPDGIEVQVTAGGLRT